MFKSTNFNPYLVSLLAKLPEDDFNEEASTYMTKHAFSILDDMKKFGELHRFCTQQYTIGHVKLKIKYF